MDHTLVAIEFEDGGVSRMQFRTRRKQHQLDRDVAVANGFELKDGFWVREATDALIERAISRTAWGADLGRPVKWWRVQPGEALPRRQARFQHHEPEARFQHDEPVQPEGASETVSRTDTYEALLNAARQEAGQAIAQAIESSQAAMARYNYELQVALNALKSDAEVSTDPSGKMRQVREDSIVLLSELAGKLGVPWDQHAREIIARHDADAVALLRG